MKYVGDGGAKSYKPVILTVLPNNPGNVTETCLSGCRIIIYHAWNKWLSETDNGSKKIFPKETAVNVTKDSNKIKVWTALVNFRPQ